MSTRFFPLDIQTWPRACDLGLHAAVTYLLLVSGRRGRGLSTRWGVHAVETYGGLSRGQAKAAIASLTRAGLLSPVEGLTRTLAESSAPTYVWLPQTFIHGAAGEPSPLVRLRETGDVLTLRLAVHLYDRHLVDPEDSGLPLTLYRQTWTKTVLLTCREWYVAAFTPDHQVVTNAATADDPLMAPLLEPAAHKQHPDLEPYWTRMRTLRSMGLLRPVVRLMESDDPNAVEVHSLAPGQIVWPSDLPVEAEVAAAAERAAVQILESDPQASDRLLDVASDETVVLPIRGHMGAASLMTGWRLTYRPHTTHTARWLARVDETCRAATAVYQGLHHAWARVSDASGRVDRAVAR